MVIRLRLETFLPCKFLAHVALLDIEDSAWNGRDIRLESPNLAKFQGSIQGAVISRALEAAGFWGGGLRA